MKPRAAGGWTMEPPHPDRIKVSHTGSPPFCLGVLKEEGTDAWLWTCPHKTVGSWHPTVKEARDCARREAAEDRRRWSEQLVEKGRSRVAAYVARESEPKRVNPRRAWRLKKPATARPAPKPEPIRGLQLPLLKLPCQGPGCPQELAYKGNGRPPRFCSAACRQAAYRRRAQKVSESAPKMDARHGRRSLSDAAQD